MKLSDRLSAFISLGESIQKLSLTESKSLAEKARNENPWFTEESVWMSLKGIAMMLEGGKLTSWAESYKSNPAKVKCVGVAMAGNIPLVGFHDFLCILMAGHLAKIKLSSQDTVLLKSLFQKLSHIEPRFAERVIFADQLKGVEAMIATGSDNTARYFEYYFRNIPHIIRKNRSSCALIVGEEPPEEFELLGKDIFSYFGLGCRNISKLYIPEDFDFKPMIESWKSLESVIDHNKYANNYDYQKALLLVDQQPFLDTGFALIRESKGLVSPIGTIFYERYGSQAEAKEKIEVHQKKLQLVASAKGWLKESVPFGQTQFPQVNDYADKIDTMRFLESLI